ncbi:response regulator transcription factor [Streptomyces sp. NPDC005865]|uniref:response regulator transcription factor n=1 Tax=Streptomyces sp. NPDC005865 TaxID=3155453 RepID=UPI0034110F4A
MITVLVVDDDALVRRVLSSVVAAGEDLHVVGEARDGAAALEQARLLQPDVVLLDIRMPRMDGVRAARELTALPHPPKVIMLTTFSADEYIQEALAHGAVGFLLKDIEPAELVRAVHTVAQGRAMLSPEVTKKLIDSYSAARSVVSRQDRERLARLSPREHDVLLGLAQGLSNAEIARQLDVAPGTVKIHVGQVLTKLHAANRTQAAVLAHQAGLLPPS